MVAPLAGAWIEIIYNTRIEVAATSSLPSRERGLKFHQYWKYQQSQQVAPLAGAWIEILYDFFGAKIVLCRSPRGSVD